jgi:hypothetical protein
MKNTKNAYYQEYYKQNAKKQAHANYEYWYKKAKVKYHTETPSNEQIRETRNEYYRNYRKNKPEIIKKNQEDFFRRYAESKDTLDN